MFIISRGDSHEKCIVYTTENVANCGQSLNNIRRSVISGLSGFKMSVC